MQQDDLTSLAKAWISLQTEERDSPTHDQLFWAFEDIQELRNSDPEACWAVINEIRRQDCSEKILAKLAAGPLEDLLVAHGARFIDRIETLAAADMQFRKLLGAVWKNDIDEGIWRRVQAVAGPSF